MHGHAARIDAPKAEPPSQQPIAELLLELVVLLQAGSQQPLSARDPAAKPLVFQLHLDLPFEPRLRPEQIASLLGLKPRTVKRWIREEKRRRAQERPAEPRPGEGPRVGTAPASGPGEDPVALAKPKRKPSPERRHPAYDDATMTVAASPYPFHWNTVARRFVGLLYAAESAMTAAVMVGVEDDGHVCLFAEEITKSNGDAIGEFIGGWHASAAVDAVLHSSPHHGVHFDIEEAVQDWQRRAGFPLVPHTGGPEPRRHLTALLEAGRFTLYAQYCPTARAELRADARPADHPHPEGPTLLALCTVLDYLHQQAAG